MLLKLRAQQFTVSVCSYKLPVEYSVDEDAVLNKIFIFFQLQWHLVSNCMSAATAFLVDRVPYAVCFVHVGTLTRTLVINPLGIITATAAGTRCPKWQEPDYAINYGTHQAFQISAQ